jgi:hypothetical protein
MRRAIPVGLCAVVLAAGGCGPPQGTLQQAGATARDFYAAVRAHNGVVACGLLAPETRREVEQSGRAPCPQALVQQDLPDADAAREVTVYGDQAIVSLDADTVFLTEMSAGWRVTAAGCQRRPELPYECMVRGR